MDTKLLVRFEEAANRANVPPGCMFGSVEAEWAYRNAQGEVARLTPLVLLELAKAVQRLEEAAAKE